MPVNAKPNKPGFKFISSDDPIPNTRFFSHRTSSPRLTRIQFQPKHEARQPLVEMPKKKKKFTFLTLGVLGCGGSSSSVSVPAANQPAAKWEAKKVRGKKKSKKRQSNHGSATSNNTKTPDNVVVNVPDVCCAPPGIGFAYDVAPRARTDAARKPHRERSQATRPTVNVDHPCPAPQSDHSTIWLRTNVSDSRQYSHLRHRTHGGISEIILFQHDPLLEGSSDGSDRFGDWRLNVDSMSYEELLELSEKIGYVGGGLQEDEILSCIKKPRQSFLRSLSFVKPRDKDWKCSICQEECKGEDELGRLDCGHYHHIDCIKQWLLQKNLCPVCKTAAKPGK